VVICNTGVAAHKAAGARDAFNQRVAAYEIGMLLIKERFPELAPRLTHLRDLNADYLAIDDAVIYEVLLALPERITRDGLAAALPQQAARLHQLCGTHADPPDGYAVRAVCLFGVAECHRSRLAAERLKTGDVAGFGELMNLSHEGDRLSHLEGGQRVYHSGAIADAQLRQLLIDRRSHDRARVKASAICRQPGGYMVSCHEGDEMVDIARQVEGVVGARLVGAGFGGVVAVLVAQEQASALMDALRQLYYLPRRMPPALQVCIPLEGSGVLAM
jgi:galactokinase